MIPADVLSYLETASARHEAELLDFLRIPTVSADPAYRNDLLRGAEFVRQQLANMGCTAEIVPTGGHPIVYGEWLKAPGAPTVMVYGHYDVQPADPLDLWETPPFDPQIRQGRVYARGATDDKGQVYTHLKSAEAWLAATGKLPVNLKFVIEGEEEVGSKHLDEFLHARREALKCDVAVVSDTSQYGPNQPAITYGLRGILAAEVVLTGPKKDLHSGIFGGAVANPANVLTKLMASLHDEQGRVRIPGFYDAVQPLTATERQQFADLQFNDDAFRAELGIDATAGEAGFTTLERRWARPTCDINGMYSGYTGVGPKTIIPSKATAKITCRLVPNQDPHQLTQALENYLRSQCPPSVKLDFHAYHGCPGFVLDPESPYVHAAARAIQAAWSVERVRLIREGGSIPVVQSFKEVLGVDTLLLGWGLNTDNLHSPNEHMTLRDFHRGIEASARLWAELADQR